MPPADPAAPQVPENRTVRALRETTFHASRLEPDGEYGEMFEAADWAEAERICEERGWMLRGRGGYQMSGIDEAEADAIIAAMNEREGGPHA
jgi:hypothetical protein